MNYYQRHIGDYAKDTGHLSMLEHGAYTILLDRYYSTETGIPEDQAYRVCRARTLPEKQAVDVVLSEFFHLVDGKWTNRRADEEIARMREQAKKSQDNGRLGGRPKKEPIANPEVTQSEPRRNPAETQQVISGIPRANPEITQSEPRNNLNQEPITKQVNQNLKTQAAAAIPLRVAAAAANPADWSPEPDPIACRSVELAVLLRRRGASLQASDPRVRAWAASGISDAEALSALEIAQQRRADSGANQPIGAGLIAAILADGACRKDFQADRHNPFAGAI